MAILETGLATASTQAAVESRAMRVIPVGRGNAYAASATSGVIAAALGANSSVFAMRLNPGSVLRAHIERICVQFTTIVAFTTPVTAARSLALFRGTGAAASAGTAMTPVSKDSTFATSQCLIANGGDMRISATAGLTVTGITFEATPLCTMTLSHVGNAGNYQEAIWESHATESYPIVLTPGQVLAIRNPVAMDPAGTWQFAINIDWHEAAPL